MQQFILLAAISSTRGLLSEESNVKEILLKILNMPFICASIRSGSKVLKPWFARSVLDGSKTLSDLFSDFSSGEFDGGLALDEQYQTAQVSCMTTERCQYFR